MKRFLQITMFFLLAVGTASAAPTTQPYLLHLPGVGGHLRIDDNLIRGLREGGVEGDLEIYDWTGADRGLNALLATKRHDEQSTIVAQMLADKVHANPGIHVTLTSHSGGCGIAAWALAKLPNDVVIDDWIMMESALSPDFDLSRALSHVRHAYSLYSPIDPVLDFGTRTAGTVDGVYSKSAGLTGYSMPATADPKQYEKLKQFEYQPSWMRYNDIGDHIGPMRYPFARFMIAPLLKTGELPQLPTLAPAATRDSDVINSLGK